jgi:hypothetical protein
MNTKKKYNNNDISNILYNNCIIYNFLDSVVLPEFRFKRFFFF